MPLLGNKVERFEYVAGGFSSWMWKVDLATTQNEEDQDHLLRMKRRFTTWRPHTRFFLEELVR